MPLAPNYAAPLGPPEEEAGGVLTIDLAALTANWQALKSRAGNAETAAVVKAEAYGCGTAPVSAALASAGCRTFFVAHLAEARAVRAVAANATIYVLNGLAPGTAPAYAQNNLRPVLGSVEELQEWRAFVDASGWRGGAALHIDTGINRLGLTPEEAVSLHNDLTQSGGVSLLMSHLACAEQPNHPLNAKQLADFRRLRSLFPGIPASLSNSSGIFLGREAHHDLVRPGVALYGGNPTPGQPNPMQPVVRLAGRVVQVRSVAAGETVGYGATWIAGKESRIAVLSLGYADGLPRSASSAPGEMRGQVRWNGEPCPIAGRISMDLLAVDVTDVSSAPPQRGDWMSVLDESFGVDELAARAGTIAYEILTNLGRRYHRVYR